MPLVMLLPPALALLSSSIFHATKVGITWGACKEMAGNVQGGALHYLTPDLLTCVMHYRTPGLLAWSFITTRPADLVLHYHLAC